MEVAKAAKDFLISPDKSGRYRSIVKKVTNRIIKDIDREVNKKICEKLNGK